MSYLQCAMADVNVLQKLFDPRFAFAKPPEFEEEQYYELTRLFCEGIICPVTDQYEHYKQTFKFSGELLWKFHPTPSS